MITTDYPLSLPACHGRLDALRYALRLADAALASCLPLAQSAPDVYGEAMAARQRIAEELA